MKSRQAVYRSNRVERICGGPASLILLGCGAVGLAVDEPQKPGTHLKVYPATPGTILEGRVAATVEGRLVPLLLRRVFHSDSTGPDQP